MSPRRCGRQHRTAVRENRVRPRAKRKDRKTEEQQKHPRGSHSGLWYVVYMVSCYLVCHFVPELSLYCRPRVQRIAACVVGLWPQSLYFNIQRGNWVCCVCVLHIKTFSTRRHPAHPVSVPVLPPRVIETLRSQNHDIEILYFCLLYTSPSPRD